MQEYFSFKSPKINLKFPLQINEDLALLKANYNNENINFMTPPLYCKNVKLWKKNNTLSRCLLELEISNNYWRFKKCLEEITEECKKKTVVNSKKWFKYMFSPSFMENNYEKILNNNTIEITIDKKKIKKNDRKKIKKL